MKKPRQAVCPGCSRHCTANEIRCKRGRAYFAKINENTMNEDGGQQATFPKKHKHKWEKNVAQDGMLWHMFCISRSIKKSLRRGDIAEAQLLNALSESEKTQMLELLHKMNRVLPREKKSPECG